ncbi:MAG: hypothetical protein ABSD82_07750 [Solirubrobacteraceae bacterium]
MQQAEPPCPSSQHASSQQPLSQQLCPAVQQKLPELQQVLLQQVGLPLASWQQLSPSTQHRVCAQQVPPAAQHWPLQTVASCAPKIDPGQQMPSKQESESQHVASAPVPHNVLGSGQHL